MSRRGDKRRKKKKQRGPRATEVRWLEVGPMRMEQHGRHILTRVDADHPDFAAWTEDRQNLVASLPGDIAALRGELQDMLEPFDAFDVVTDLWLANLPMNPETYRESAEDAQLVVPELAAALMIGRPSRAGSTQDSWFARHGADVQKKLKQLLILEQMQIYAARATPTDDPVFDEIRAHARAHHMAVRGVSYSWQEEETTRQLCGGEIEAELVDTVGFSVDQAFTLMESITQIGLYRVEARIEEAHRFADELTDVVDALRRGEEVDIADYPSEFLNELVALKQSVAASRVRIFAASWASYQSGEAVSFTVTELARVAGLDEAVASAFLSCFSLGFGFTPDGGREPQLDDLRLRPILDDGGGNYLCCSPHNLLWAVRRAYESAATAREATRERYNDHRSRIVEERAVTALATAVRADWSQVGAGFDVVEDGQTKGLEVDGIIRVDTAVFLIEAKSSSMRPGARRGAPDSLREWLRGEVGRGGMQLRRAREALFNDAAGSQPNLTDKQGRSLGCDLTNVEHVVELIVVLEDLPNIAPVTWRMADAGILPPDETPIVISLHELEVICEVSSRPCELVHYFLRRKRLNRQRRVSAIDELDFFMHYLRDGLYWDDAADASNEIETAPVNLLSHTDELDAYYMFKRGERKTRAAKPERRHHRDVAEVLDMLDGIRKPNRLSVALSLLDLDRKPRERVVGDMRRLKKLAKAEGHPKDRSYYGSDFGVTVMAVPPEDSSELPQMLHTYCTLKKHQIQTDTWAGFGVFAGPPELFQTAVVLNSPWKPDPDLDRLVAELPSYAREGEQFDAREQSS